MRLNRKHIVTLALGAVVALGITAGCGGSQQQAGNADKIRQIGILQLVQHGALDESNQGFVTALADRGYKEGQNIKIDQQNAQGDQSNLKTISQRFVNNKVDLIYAIATPAAQAVANETKTIPIVGSAITDFVSAKLVKSNEEPGGNVTGTMDHIPAEKQVDLALQLIPQAKTVGALYTSSEANSLVQVAAMKAYAVQRGLTVTEVAVTNVNDIQQAVQSLVGKVDFVYCPTDNTLASAMANIAKIAVPAKLPVFAGDETMVRAGGTAGVAVSFYKLGYQAGEMAADILDGKAKPATTPIGAQKDMKIIVNREGAAAIGLAIPEAIQQIAE